VQSHFGSSATQALVCKSVPKRLFTPDIMGCQGSKVSKAQEKTAVATLLHEPVACVKAVNPKGEAPAAQHQNAEATTEEPKREDPVAQDQSAEIVTQEAEAEAPGTQDQNTESASNEPIANTAAQWRNSSCTFVCGAETVTKEPVAAAAAMANGIENETPVDANTANAEEVVVGESQDDAMTKAEEAQEVPVKELAQATTDEIPAVENALDVDDKIAALDKSPIAAKAEVEGATAAGKQLCCL